MPGKKAQKLRQVKWKPRKTTKKNNQQNPSDKTSKSNKHQKKLNKLPGILLQKKKPQCTKILAETGQKNPSSANNKNLSNIQQNSLKFMQNTKISS